MGRLSFSLSFLSFSTLFQETMIFHPLDTSVQPPVRLNNPFYYEPDALCQLAIVQLAAYLRGDKGQTFAERAVDASFQAEIAKGKMFGVVIVQHDGGLGYIAGYSGQIAGCSDWHRLRAGSL